MKNKKIVIAGGSGFIGQSLAQSFGKENNVTILTRQLPNQQTNSYHHEKLKTEVSPNVFYEKWDAVNLHKNWTDTLEGADILINLTGQSVNCRYNEKEKERVLSSRLISTKLLGEAIRQCKNPPALWINSSSATIYKHSQDAPYDEITGVISKWKKDNMPFSLLDQIRFRLKRIYRGIKFGKEHEKTKDLDLDFSIKVCQQWEEAFFTADTAGTRKIALRMSIILGEGGVIVPLSRLAKYGLGGIQGNGRQMFSWTHIKDLIGVIDWLSQKNDCEGVFNVASPNAVSNATLMACIRKYNNRKWGLPAPAFLLELGAILIRTETELILKSRWVIPKRLIDTGYDFQFPTLEKALADIYNSKSAFNNSTI